MYKDRQKNKYQRRIIVTTVVLIVFSILALLVGRSPSSIEMIFKDTIANIEYYLVKTPIQYVSGVFSEFNELKDVYEENELLKEQLDKYAREAAINETLSLELQQMKDITNIDFLPTDYNVRYTKVVSRDVESWTNEITIDLGETSGVKEGMAVVSAKGMIGTVTRVDKISSTVSLLSAENPHSQLPVMIMSGGEEYYGLLNKFDVQSQSYRITLLSNVEKLDKDAKVVTSGLGGVGKSPKGILVGTVSSFTPKSEATESVCQVKPSADFDALSYVAVVQRVNAK